MSVLIYSLYLLAHVDNYRSSSPAYISGLPRKKVYQRRL